MMEDRPCGAQVETGDRGQSGQARSRYGRETESSFAVGGGRSLVTGAAGEGRELCRDSGIRGGSVLRHEYDRGANDDRSSEDSMVGCSLGYDGTILGGGG